MNTSILFDTETDDLLGPDAKPLDQQPQIIQIHAEKVNSANGELLDTFSTFVRSSRPVPAEITKITSITDAMLTDAPRWGEIALEFQTFMAGSDEIVAFNLPFDIGVVEVEYARLELAPEWPQVHLCLSEETEHLLGRRAKMMEVYEHLFDRTFTGAHLAQNDVAAMREIFTHLRLEGEV